MIDLPVLSDLLGGVANSLVCRSLPGFFAFSGDEFCTSSFDCLASGDFVVGAYNVFSIRGFRCYGSLSLEAGKVNDGLAITLSS